MTEFNQAPNRRVLVIDDNRAIHEDFQKILGANCAAAAALDESETKLFGERAGPRARMRFNIDSAYQGQEALKLVEAARAAGQPYAMAFVDVRMPPGWDGIETVGRLWAVDPELQMVICTAYSDYSWDEMLERLGQTDRLVILKKPFDNIEVQQLAHALTEKWRLGRQANAKLDELQAMVSTRTEELQEANDKLRQSQQAALQQERLAVVGQLSAGVAHEFNNILTVIQGHADLLLSRGSADLIVKKSLEQIISSSGRAANLTRQLLAFSRRQVMQSRSLDFNELTKNVAKMLGRVLGEDISLHCDYADSRPCVWADPGMMEQVILNLALNARDAMPKGGLLTITTEVVEISPNRPRLHLEARLGHFICFQMSDTGCGMDPATLRQIFEPFFTTKDVGKGTGLGLASVYGIVKQHQGWLEVESESGKGSMFKVFLPISSQPAETRSEKPAAPPADRGTETILVVEDEPSLRKLVSDVLKRYGYAVLEASSGKDALQVWDQHGGKIDLLLSDMVMPAGMSGRDLVEKLHARKSSLKVILTSGYSLDLVEKNALVREGIHFLPKPFPPAKLAQLIRECLDSDKNQSDAGGHVGAISKNRGLPDSQLFGNGFRNHRTKPGGFCLINPASK